MQDEIESKKKQSEKQGRGRAAIVAAAAAQKVSLPHSAGSNQLAQGDGIFVAARWRRTLQ